VFVGKGGRLPARVRVLLDFLVKHVTQEVIDGGGLGLTTSCISLDHLRTGYAR
jgi:hypothetical protein